ncbi:MAG TPA: cation transporter, partial [Kofleriaceae bacterium]
FWSMIVAMSIFGMGGVLSIYEGCARVIHPHRLESSALGFIVLGASFVFEGISWSISMKSFGRVRGRKSLWKAIEQSKDPTTFVVVLEDSAALIGLAIAALTLAIATWTGEPRVDAVGSILIGLLLVTSGIVLGRETWSLMIGESASPKLVADIERIAREREELIEVATPRTLHLGPDHVHVDLDVQARGDVSARELGELLHALERSVRAAHPEVGRISIRLT